MSARGTSLPHFYNLQYYKNNFPAMQKLHFSILIHASQQKVWETMLNDTTYRQWTSAFMECSYYEGSWTPGTKMRFLASNTDGTLSGMLSEIEEVTPYSFVSIQNLGEIINNKEALFTKEKTEGYQLFENYTFTQKGDFTELTVDFDSPEQMTRMFQEMWPKALEKLKGVVEQ